MRRFSARLGTAEEERSGFTLIELLAVISVVGVLLALLLPAVQSTREAARQVHCRNSLRQLNYAIANFESTHGHLPSNGWGFLWIGDPDRGVGKQQPGGWIYQLLPFVEQGNLARIGVGLDDTAKEIALADLIQSPVRLFRCPTRPSELLTPSNSFLIWHNAGLQPLVAKTDYAICEGDWISDTDDGPASLEEGDDPEFAWPDLQAATGVSFQRSEVRMAQILDGTSQTYLIGEKHVSLPAYRDDSDWGNDQPLYSGVDVDLARWTIAPPILDGHDNQRYRQFGSAHTDGCHMSLCDGSVRFVSYAIDGGVHRRLGNRHDGEVASIP